MKFVYGAFLTLALASTASHAAQTYSVVEDSAKVGFLALGKPGFLKIKGEGGRLKGRLDATAGGLKGDLIADLARLKTGVDLRDSHMHDKYLETKAHPTAALILDTITFEKGTEGSCAFTGSLVLKAVKKPIQGSCEVTGLGKDTLQVKANGDIKLEDYPIGVPSYLGVKVADKVTIEVAFDAKLGPST